MENINLLEALQNELKNTKEKNKNLTKINEILKVRVDILDQILKTISTEEMCQELKLRRPNRVIELNEKEKIFISTSKGIDEFQNTRFIVVL